MCNVICFHAFVETSFQAFCQYFNSVTFFSKFICYFFTDRSGLHRAFKNSLNQRRKTKYLDKSSKDITGETGEVIQISGVVVKSLPHFNDGLL